MALLLSSLILTLICYTLTYLQLLINMVAYVITTECSEGVNHSEIVAVVLIYTINLRNIEPENIKKST